MEPYGNYVTNTEGKNFKPCPFCGSRTQEIYETACGVDKDSYYYKYAVFCECGAAMTGLARLQSADNSSRDLAITNAAETVWNRRSY